VGTCSDRLPISRRAALRSGLGGAVLASLSACAPGTAAASFSDQAAGVYEFNRRWLFGGGYTSGAELPGYPETGYTEVTLPHTVATLSWRNWNPGTWQDIWIYRRHFDAAALRGERVFVEFDGVMTNAAVVLNGHKLATHQGGYLPWSAELTSGLTGGDNLLAVVVDSRWLAVPPDGAPKGAAAVDFLQPGGIYRDVRLHVVPEAFISDVFAKPVDVLTSHRRVEVTCTVDPGRLRHSPLKVTVELLDGAKTLASGSAPLRFAAAGDATASVSLTRIKDVTLWGPDTPKLYTVCSTLSGLPGGVTHTHLTRIGFRAARFELDGFYLNGRRLTIFGLNRHQLFPFTGMAAPARLQRRDAEILRNDFNCNMVRCAHYPQSPHFLDACDELGLMVWEEPPGWQYVGNAASQEIITANVHDMVVRDRNRPSVIIWGTRLNETIGYPDLYRRTIELARHFDGSRQTSGAMGTRSTANWVGDVFAFDDYHVHHTGDARLLPPLDGHPYLVTEAVGTLEGVRFFRWTDPGEELAKQAILHAQVHEIAQSDPRYAGLLGWTGFDYASLHGNIWDDVKWPGVSDTFRVPKPGAAFYRSQLDPRVRPVILPVFFWDFGRGDPGQDAMIATNCDRLEIYVAGLHAATGYPDVVRFGHLAYPPVFVDLTVNPLLVDITAGITALPELRIDGYVRGRHVASARMSADTSRDRLVITAQDASIVADGFDATRVTFRAMDAYGNQRCCRTGTVSLSLHGPAVLVGDNPFAFGDYGGVGGAFVRSLAGRTGLVTVTAEHAVLGRASARIRVNMPGPGRRFL
jgi:beta-galactosidase